MYIQIQIKILTKALPSEMQLAYTLIGVIQNVQSIGLQKCLALNVLVSHMNEWAISGYIVKLLILLGCFVVLDSWELIFHQGFCNNSWLSDCILGFLIF